MAAAPDRSSAGDAYLVHPHEGPGPGVLLLHSWWGLTPSVKQFAESVADLGYTVLAPDLCEGEAPVDAESARLRLAGSDPNVTADLILKSLTALRAVSVEPDRAVAVLGFSMGASWGLWLATRSPGSVDAVVAYYGTQNIDFDDLTAPVLGHFAEHDELVSDDELVEMQARLLLSDKHVEVHHYEGTRHWFAETDVASSHDPDAAAVAWSRTVEFLTAHHPPRTASSDER